MLSRTVLRAAPFQASAVLLGTNKGKVVSWINHRGFGFIEDDADKKQVFVHFSQLSVVDGGNQSVNQGQEVEFDLTMDGDRSKAVNVTSVGGDRLPSGPPRPEYVPRGRGGDRGGGGFRGGRGGGFRGGRGGGQRNDPMEDF